MDRDADVRTEFLDDAMPYMALGEPLKMLRQFDDECPRSLGIVLGDPTAY